jgi:diaminopimelate epimerase
VTLRKLQKWHGAGNDFLVDVVTPSGVRWWNAERASAVCQRATGVGADGLIVAALGPRVSMELFNADGSVAEMSGNGIRCLAAAVRKETNATWQTLDVLTPAGVRTVDLTMNGDAGYGGVSMGEVVFQDPIEGALGVATVGNPHVVVVDDPSWPDNQREEMAEKWSHIPGGVNVEFVSVKDSGHLSMRVIERGVGWTLACGTGSVAAAAVFHREDLCDDDVVIDNPGGALRVQLHEGYATLSGPVQFVATIEWLEA